MGRSETNMGRSETNIGRSKTNMGRSETNMGRSETNMGRSKTDYGVEQKQTMPRRSDCCHSYSMTLGNFLVEIVALTRPKAHTAEKSSDSICRLFL